MKLGTYIKNKRKSLGFTQRDLARRLGLTDIQALSNIERNVALVPVKRVKDFARVLGISEDFILLYIVRERLKEILKNSRTDSEKLKFLLDILAKLSELSKETLELLKALLNKIQS